MPRLKRVDCSGPGIIRRRRGRGFEYLDPLVDERVTDRETIQRIKDLAIPPAWEDVWICPFPMGHIQAVGTDVAGRKQYIYHQKWRERRDQEKFDHMLDFARVLPKLRRACGNDLRRDGFDRDKVLGCATRLLDLGFFRIGTEDYAEQNQTYGLATIKKQHVHLNDSSVTFNYVSKGRKRRVQSIVDPDVFNLVAALKKRRGGGEELLAYKSGRRWTDVKSADINDYIREKTKGDFTAKDFRTWSATVLAAIAVAVSGEARSATARKRAITRACAEVSHYLGNTPAVCRASYIDPRVFDRYRSGWSISGVLDVLGEDATLGSPSTQGVVEEAVLDLLEDNNASPAVEKVA